MKVNIEKTRNQIETIFVHRPDSQAGSIQMWFNAGSALEQKEDWGVAHFLEHMFFKGTPKRPGSKIAFETEAFGGEVNAFTSFDYTCYYINTPCFKLQKSLDILLDMVANPLFSKEDIPAEIEVVHEEYLRSQDSPKQFSFQKLQKTLFTAGGYSHPILGSLKHIKNFKRNQIVNFRKRHYNKANLRIVIAGDISNKASLIKTIEKYDFPKGKENDFPKFSIKSKAKVSVVEKDVEMIHLDYVIPALAVNEKNSPAEDLAWTCFGGGESSLLYQKLVQKDSLCNSSGTYSHYFKSGGMHMLRLNCPKENLDEALERLSKTILEYFETGVSKEALQKVKNQYIASKVYEKESIEQFAFSLGHSMTQYKDLNIEDQFLHDAENAGLDKVNSAIKNILSRTVHINALVPEKYSSKEFEAKLNKHLIEINQHTQPSFKENYSWSKSKVDSKVRRYKIKEGVQLIYRHNDLTPTFSFQAYLKSGLANETTKNNGIHHQIANMIVQGHSGLDVYTYKSEIENLAASINGFAGKNAYGLTCHGQTKDFDTLLQHFGGCLFNSNFDEEVLSNELMISKRYLDALQRDAAKKCFELITNVMFKDHPYAYNIVGNNNSLENINSSSIKEMHNQNLATKELLFYYGGPALPEDVIKKCELLLSNYPARKKHSFAPVELAKLEAKQHFLEFDREQTHLFLGFPIAHLDSDIQIFYKILSSHLSGQSSDLFVKMRDELGLCYVVQPVHFSALQCGYWGIYMASSDNKAKEAISELKATITQLAENGISNKDLSRVKEVIKGQSLLGLQTNDDYASAYCIPLLHDLNIDFFYKQIEKIEKYTINKFNKTLKRELTQNFQKFAVGRTNPFEE